MVAKPPEAVVFDIGRVIVRLDLQRAFTAFSLGVSTSKSLDSSQVPTPQQIWTTIQTDRRFFDWQEGRITPQRWYEHITRQLGVTVAFEEFCVAWNSMLDPQAILPDNLFAQLATRYRLGLLSNTDPIHAAHLEACYSFVEHFPVRIYSHEVGASKPSPVIYQAALTALDVTPAEALYIDDVAEYAEAARQLGFDAIQFETPQQLGGELSRRGLIP